MERCHSLGCDYADEWIENCNDYGELSLVVNGIGLQELPEHIKVEITSRDFVMEFVGVPDHGAVLNGLNEALNSRRNELAMR